MVLDGPYGLLVFAFGVTWGGVLSLAFAAAALYVLVTFGLWIVERRLSGDEPDEPGEAHREALGKTIMTEVVSAGGLLSIHVLGMVDPPTPAPLYLRSGRPILFVHGYLQSRSSFIVLGLRLSNLGLGPFYTVNLHTLEGDLLYHAETLSDRIEQIRKATGSPQVDVVAHSMGGLVARLVDLGRAEPRVRRLVTLGTPHRGTQVAHLAFGSAGRQMRPASEIVQSLPRPVPGQLVSISSTHDAFVVPPENARVGPLGRDIVVHHVGHLSLLTNPDVGMEVAKALGEDILTRRSQDLFERIEGREVELAAPSLTGRSGGVSGSLARLGFRFEAANGSTRGLNNVTRAR